MQSIEQSSLSTALVDIIVMHTEMNLMPTHLNIYRMCLFSIHKQMFIVARRLDAYVGTVYETHDPREPTNPVEGGSRLHSLFAETI